MNIQAHSEIETLQKIVFIQFLFIFFTWNPVKNKDFSKWIFFSHSKNAESIKEIHYSLIFIFKFSTKKTSFVSYFSSANDLFLKVNWKKNFYFTGNLRLKYLFMCTCVLYKRVCNTYALKYTKTKLIKNTTVIPRINYYLCFCFCCWSEFY